jgi:hypothetical protein
MAGQLSRTSKGRSARHRSALRAQKSRIRSDDFFAVSFQNGDLLLSGDAGDIYTMHILGGAAKDNLTSVFLGGDWP